MRAPPRSVAGAWPGRLAAVVLAVVLVGACGGRATPGPDGTPGGTADGAAIARSFVAILTDPALRATIVQQATVSSESAGEAIEIRVTMGGDLALPDISLRVAIETEGETTGFALVVVEDRSFVDLGEGWIEAPRGSVDTSELTDALVMIDDPGDLAYVGAEVVDGETLHHLVATGPLPYSPGGIPGTGDAVGTIQDLDAYVEADGTPVRIALSFSATNVDATGTTRVFGTTEIRFADVGGAQVIAIPSLAPTAPPAP